MIIIIVWIAVANGIITDPDWLLTVGMDAVLLFTGLVMYGDVIFSTVKTMFRMWYMRDALRIRRRAR